MRIGELDDIDTPEAGNATESVRELYLEHAADLHAYLGRRVGRDVADDLLADTFRIAIEDWTTYDASIGSARNWLYGISTNLARRHWRSSQRQRSALDRLRAVPTDHDSLDDPARTAARRIDAVSEARLLLDAVDALDAEDRDVLTLTAWESMSSADVAEVLGIPRGTVRSRLHRIRRQLDVARRAPRPRPETQGDRA